MAARSWVWFLPSNLKYVTLVWTLFPVILESKNLIEEGLLFFTVTKK